MLIHPLLSLRLRRVELRALVSGENVANVRILLIANRERLGLNVAANLVESCARASGIALLPQRTDIVELRLVLVANRLELRAILLVNRLHLRLLCVGQI